jgi:uncharacterized protein with HEPN domain
MDEYIEKHLIDILNAATEVESYFADAPKRFQDFQNDMLRQRAVERNVEALHYDIKQQPAAALVYPTTEWQPAAARIDPGRMYSYLRR